MQASANSESSAALRENEIFTIGHGNRPLEEFTALLHQAGVRCLVDVRAFPGSRRHPHFGRDELAHSLTREQIEYEWAGESLGGRRRPRADSPHVALRNASFRAYADLMETAEFAEAAKRLTARAAGEPIAIMCAERLPWQCHRYMIADYLVAHGARVVHLIDAGKPREHTLRREARIAGSRLIYDAQTQTPLDFD